MDQTEKHPSGEDSATYRFILDQVGAYIFTKDLEGRYTYANRSVADLFGTPPSEIIGSTDERFFDLSVCDSLRKNDLRVLLHGERVEGEETNVVASTGETRIYWTVKIPLRNAAGAIVGLCGISTDITERKQSEDILSQLGQILNESPCEIYTIDAESLRFIYVNAGALKNLGYSIFELHQMTPIDIKPTYTRESFEELLSPLRSGEKDLIVIQTEHRRKDGNIYPVEVRLQFSRTASPPVFVAIVQNITERKNAEQRIAHMASHDALTDLPNRRVFLDRLSKTLLQSERTREGFALGILDLDGFKDVNDRLGHPMGDELLIQVARRIEGLLRKTDTLARLGGDEFGLLLTDLKEGEDYQDLFSKIVGALLVPFDLGSADGPVRISGSLGLTLCPPDLQDVSSLIAHADLALYQVKNQGKNGWALFERSAVLQ